MLKCAWFSLRNQHFEKWWGEEGSNLPELVFVPDHAENLQQSLGMGASLPTSPATQVTHASIAFIDASISIFTFIETSPMKKTPARHPALASCSKLFAFAEILSISRYKNVKVPHRSIENSNQLDFSSPTSHQKSSINNLPIFVLPLSFSPSSHLLSSCMSDGG